MSDILRRVSSLMGIYNRIADALDLDVLLNRLIEIITEALNADRSTLFLHDEETEELFSRVAQATSQLRYASERSGNRGQRIHVRRADHYPRRLRRPALQSRG